MTKDKIIVVSDLSGAENSIVLAAAAHGLHPVMENAPKEEEAAMNKNLRQLKRQQDAETLLKMADYLKLFRHQIETKEDYLLVSEDREPSAWKRFTSHINGTEAVKETVRIGFISRTYRLDWLFPVPNNTFIVEAADDSRSNIKKMETIGKNLQREFEVPVASLTWMRSPRVIPGFPKFTPLYGTFE
ncbi:Uncharacterised protein [uncultured archaeon]|nr:Uncharacterised protein [uncultured archaeon]